MEKEFVTYEQALALKELGFDGECLAGYIRLFSSGTFEIAFYKDRTIDFNTTSNIYVSAPLKQQIFKFFRDKYNLEGVTQRHDDGTAFKFWIHKYHENNKSIEYGGYDYPSHEEAENACIDKLIEIAKQQ
jgi:hypothetical protein